jgi:hypothetical protein
MEKWVAYLSKSSVLPCVDNDAFRSDAMVISIATEV